MAKRLQVQGPRVRSEQTKVIAPMVDTYYREEALDPTQLKAVKLAEFVTDITAKGQDLAVKIDKDKTEKGLQQLADYAWTQGDKVTFDEVVKELGIVNNDKTFYAFNQAKGDRQGQAVANELQSFMASNRAKYLDHPDSSLMESEMQEKMTTLIAAASKDEEGSFGFSQSLMARVQGRYNQITQTFMSEHGATRVKEQEEAAAIAFGHAIDTGDLSQIIKTSNQQRSTGLLSNSEIKQGILESAYAKIALDPTNAEAIADLVRQVPTAGGSTLGNIPDVSKKLYDAVNASLAADERKQQTLYTQGERGKRDEKIRLAKEYDQKTPDDEWQEVPDSEYEESKDIWDSFSEFDQWRTLRKKNNDAVLMEDVQSYENYLAKWEAIRGTPENPISLEQADAVVDSLKANARNAYEWDLIDKIARTTQTNGSIPMFSETTFKDQERLLKAKYKFADYKTWMPENPQDKNRYDAALEQLKSEYYRLKGRYTVDGTFDTEKAATALDAFRETLVGPEKPSQNPTSGEGENDGSDDSTQTDTTTGNSNTTNLGEFDGINVSVTKD